MNPSFKAESSEINQKLTMNSKPINTFVKKTTCSIRGIPRGEMHDAIGMHEIPEKLNML